MSVYILYPLKKRAPKWECHFRIFSLNSEVYFADNETGDFIMSMSLVIKGEKEIDHNNIYAAFLSDWMQLTVLKAINV